MNDESIIGLYFERSEAAITETAKKYGHYCKKIAMNILHNTEDSDECVNDTYMKAWNAIPPTRPAMFSSFLGKITRNLSLNKYKEQRTVKHGGNEIELIYDELQECIASESNVEAEYENGEIASEIDKFLFMLNEQTRIIFVQRYYYCEKISDISKRFGMSESKVKSILFRTRKKLKADLRNEVII